MTIDVEDWFHILEVDNAPALDDWPSLESRVERNVDRLLALLHESGTTSTCFLLGWVVNQHPEVARRIADAGHEIATHGYAHEMVNAIGPERFREDVERSVRAIEKATGKRPIGYRAPGFSITEDATWALEILSDLGLRFDSSIFPVKSGHGGIEGSDPLPHRLTLPNGRDLMEFPISVTALGPKRIAYCGGGYLRLFPYRFIRSRIAAANARGESVMVYVHPRDIDPAQPRIDMPRIRRFKSYVNLSTTYEKLKRLLADFEFGTVSAALQACAADAPPRAARTCS
jgi:polysaccharide deacetylase family protein (PEP-CTERM system associated)